ncbi:uncharacterized protein LOC109534234 [Dendroctonus ponderosae]|uniref:uncharacterized protein LOC109534234 n=1 Tax=Dendroctonus ponderosae TaxID=77166 RepID=UPI0020360CA3|nr:uncharacterized protein LOC109534234 [Dendroctonus ponderosae]
MLVSFDVVPLFTNVPVDESIESVAELFEESTTNLFKAFLKGSCFLWNGDYYEQKERLAIGSPLSPVVANLFMEKFEKTALSTAPLKPTIWYRYVDDTFVLWRHGRKNLDIFLDHLNKQHSDIQFTMEVEQNHQLAFLDVLVSRPGSRLDHKVYRKATHTARYLHKLSNHHPSQKQGIIKTLRDRARKICEPQHLTTELQHLEKAFFRTDVPSWTSKKLVTDRFGRLIRKHNIRTVYKPTTKIRECLGIEEHRQNCKLGHVEKSAVTEDVLSDGTHNIYFGEAQVLATITGYRPRLIREAIEIHKHDDNFNRNEETVVLNKIRFSALTNEKTARKSHSSGQERGSSTPEDITTSSQPSPIEAPPQVVDREMPPRYGCTGEMKHPERTKTSTEPRQLAVSVLTTSRD